MTSAVSSTAKQSVRSLWSPWNALAVGILALIMFVVVFAVMSTIGTQAYVAIRLSTAEGRAATIILADLAAAGAVYVFVKASRIASYETFWRSISWNYSASQCAVAVVAGVAAALLVRFALTRQLNLSLNSSASANLLFILVLTGTVLVEPLVEEVYFRGILFMGLARKMGSLASIVIVTQHSSCCMLNIGSSYSR